jgi:HTH-type transcriptional regulator/antitoxin HipB
MSDAGQDRAGVHPEDDRLSGLAQAVRARRRALGLSQAELADLAGCSERFVYSLEHAKPTVRLAKILDVLAVLGLDLQVASGAGRVVSAADPGLRR